eukprot:m.20222 g.20222  ORF g.20222 m.20222 type:complete len:57 (+) comp11015_c0_seq1:49-219(+)
MEHRWRDCQAEGLFHRFWYTDSCPTTAEQLEDEEPFRLLSLASAVAKTLLTYDLVR